MSAWLESLTLAAKLRFPVWPKEPAVGTSQKVNDLEDHISLTAYYQGELEEHRLDAYTELAVLDQRWEEIEGWQQFRRSKTETAVEDAKRQANPGLWRELRLCRWRVKRLGEQIDRLEREFVKASRLYTVLTGS